MEQIEQKFPYRTLLWITVFSIAMGFLESAVVVYLRAIYYTDGFTFPLVPLDTRIAITEIGREAATIIMLLGISVLTGKTVMQRFAWFIISFAVWDIFYYVFLYILLGWPPSLFTWDILFLIPVPWVGPVITPLIISLLMITLAVILLRSDLQNKQARIAKGEWWWFSLGSLVVIVSWIEDFCAYAHDTGISKLFSDYAMNYVPRAFNYWIFGLGALIIALTIAHLAYRLNNPR